MPYIIAFPYLRGSEEEVLIPGDHERRAPLYMLNSGYVPSK